MTVSSRNDNGQVTLFLEGHLDTASAALASTEINGQLDACGDIHALTCDIAGITFLSSSGLRLLLGLKKRSKDFRIVEAQPDIYHVLEMTGFTQMMTVERSLRRLSIEGCELIGRGGVGLVYRINEDTIIKVFRAGTTFADVQHEIQMSKETFILGMPTPISYDIVRVGDQYGLVYELLQADTLSACICREPDRIDFFAHQYADLFRQMHSIQVPSGSGIHEAVQLEEAAVRHIGRYFDTPSIDLLLRIVHTIPKSNRLLHGDLQTKNVMMQNGEPMLIDMGEVSYGHPLLDLAHSYSAMVTLVGDYESIVGLPRAYATDVWHRMINYYFAGEPQDLIDHRIAQIQALSCVRNFSWLSLSDSFPADLIRQCQSLFAERVTHRRDHLLAISQTFSDWSL